MKVYVVSEMVQENYHDKLLVDTNVFTDKEDANAYLRSRYTEHKAHEEETSGIQNEEFSDYGWYAIVNKDGDVLEGFMSEYLEVKGVV